MEPATILKALAAATPVVGVLGILYRRFRRGGTEEVESFSRYLTQGLKFYIARHLKRRLAGELTLRQYAQVHLQSTATEMLVPATYPVSLSTDRVFVPLLLRDARRGTIEYQELVEQSGDRTIVIGEPGSGKSSLMKRTFRDACRRAIADPGHAALPILFELRKLGRLLGDGLKDLTSEDLLNLCMKSLDDAAIFKVDTSASDLQHGGGLLLLLDGLDEVPREAAAHVALVITDLGDQLSKRSPKSTIIVSTRTQHYVSMHDRAFEEAFHPLSIRPFSNADIYRFLLSWPFERDRARQISRLFGRIRQLPSLGELCTNPLTLAMFVARDEQTEGEASPETRSAFYAALVEEFLVNRRHRQDDSTIGRQRLLRLREKILGSICVEHLLDPNEALNSISQDRMLAGIEGAGISTSEAPGILENLAIDTGLFSSEREGQTYRFMHLTFCEFLAATAVVNQGASQWQMVTERLKGERGGSDGDWRSRLSEVIAFSCGRAPESLANTMLSDIRRQGINNVVIRGALEAQNYSNEDVIEAAIDEANAIAEVEPDRWDVAWFSRLRWLLVVQRDIAAGIQPELALEKHSSVSPPGKFLVGLIDRWGAAELLLGALSRVDADVALDIAEESDDSALLDVVSAGADDFGTLLAILARVEKGASATWGISLVHSALREAQIAQILAEIAVDIQGSIQARRWQDWYVLKGTVYARLLDEVTMRPDAWRHEDREMLSYLASVNVPRHEWVELVRSALPVNSFPLLASMAGAVVALNLATEHIWGTVIAIVAVTLPLLVLATRAQEILAVLRHRRDEQAVAIVKGAISVALESGNRPVTDRSANRVRREGLRRSAILEEVLNLRQYRFGVDDADRLGDGTWEPSDFARILSGVTKDDIAALLRVRQMRRTTLGREDPSPPDHATEHF
jgi:hypothetical protein